MRNTYQVPIKDIISLLSFIADATHAGNESATLKDIGLSYTYISMLRKRRKDGILYTNLKAKTAYAILKYAYHHANQAPIPKQLNTAWQAVQEVEAMEPPKEAWDTLPPITEKEHDHYMSLPPADMLEALQSIDASLKALLALAKPTTLTIQTNPRTPWYKRIFS